MGTTFPCVKAAIQQWERRSHAFPLEMTPGPHPGGSQAGDATGTYKTAGTTYRRFI